MNNAKIDDFICFLDFYKSKKSISYFELVNIIQMTNLDYIENKYYQESYCGKSASDTSFYTLNEPSNWNTISKNETNDYVLWQKKHLVDINIPNDLSNNLQINKKPVLSNNSIVKTHKKDIYVSVKNISDILKIVEENPYNENTEYNIDLKSLTIIKPELEELNNMIGMETLKTSLLDQLLYFIQNLHIEKEKLTSDFKHTVIFGPPGTGKTEIAKIIGRMFSKIGILRKNIFRKVTRNDLVAGYLGQTAIKTKAVIDECLGGVLFIDEAYSLANTNRGDLDSFSKECIDTLCEALSDKKSDLMVIIAGYEDDLNNQFFQANKGLSSRFIWRYKIAEYSANELYSIFKKKVEETDWRFLDEKDINTKWFETNKKEFGNYGRDMELLFSYTKIAHARNIFGKPTEFRKKLSKEDLENGFHLFKENSKKEKKDTIPYGIYM